MGKNYIYTSKVHRFADKEIWWYAIPPLGESFRRGDSLTFKLMKYASKDPGFFVMSLEGDWLERLRESSPDSHGYIHIFIRRNPGDGECRIYFGVRDSGEYPIEVTVR